MAKTSSRPVEDEEVWMVGMADAWVMIIMMVMTMMMMIVIMIIMMTTS